MLNLFEEHKVSFVAVAQHFNTSTSLGRLRLDILLSFAQFERELIGERTRDKMSAARKKGRWWAGLQCYAFGDSSHAGDSCRLS
jgi:site-specific DNA recombinase